MIHGENIGIIIVAAGSGSRFGSELPKQFCMLGDKPVLIHAIERFQSFLPQAHIIVVVSADRLQFWNDLKQCYQVSGTAETIGGKTRWGSVRNAISQLPVSTSRIMVHDGARPLVDAKVIERLLDASDNADGALPVLPMTDSLRMATASDESHAVDRSQFFAVQTPQVFRADKLRKAYTLPYSSIMTDDASVMEAAGFNNIRLCEGSETTLKITRPIDIHIARLHLTETV